MPPKERDIEIQDSPLGEPAVAVAAIETGVVVENGRIKSGRLAGLSMWQAIFVVSWPVLVESLLNSLVGVTDTTLSAAVSRDAADGVAAASYFLWIVSLFPIALGVGATALISRAAGKGRLAVAQTVVGQCFTLSFVAGAIGTLVALVAAPIVSSRFNLKDQAHHDAVTYIRLVALAAPMQTFVSVGIACLSGRGDSLRPLLIMILINVVNILASFALSGVEIAYATTDAAGGAVRHVLIANPFPFHMGVAGISLGTVAAWTFGALAMFFVLLRGAHGVRLRARRMRLHWHTVRRLLRIGLPNLLETFGMWSGNFLVILLVGLMNQPGLLGAHIITVRIEAFSFLPGFAMSLAAATLAGQYLGAGSPALARQAVLRCLAVAAAMMGVAGLVFVCLGRQIAGVFSQQPEHLAIVPTLLIISGVSQPVFAVSIVFRSALRGAGVTGAVARITWISIFAIRLPLAWLLSGVDLPLPGGHVIPNPAPLQRLGIHPLSGFWIGLCVELSIRGILFTIEFVRGNWTKARV